MSITSPRSEQQGEGIRASGAVCSALCSASGASKKPTKSKRMHKIRRIWPLCFHRRSRRVKVADKATSTDDLHPPKDDLEAHERQGDRPEPPAGQGLLCPRRDAATSNESRDRLSTCDWVLTDHPKRKSLHRSRTPPREHCHDRRSPSPRDNGAHPNLKEQLDGNAPRTPLLEAPVLRDIEMPEGRRLPCRRGNSPGREAPCMRKCCGRAGSPAGRPRSRERSHNRGHSPSSKSPCSRYWGRGGSPAGRRPRSRERPHRCETRSVWKRAQTPRGTFHDPRSPRWKYSYGWQDLSPHKDGPAATHLKSRDKRKSTPFPRTPPPPQRKRNEGDGQALPMKTWGRSGRVMAIVFCLLLGLAAFIGVRTLPVCVSKFSREMIPREALPLELVSVCLLMLAAISILVLVSPSQDFITEIIIVLIAVLFNAALVDLVRCFCSIPGRCLWLTALVFPLFLLALLVLCRLTLARRVI